MTCLAFLPIQFLQQACCSLRQHSAKLKITFSNSHALTASMTVVRPSQVELQKPRGCPKRPAEMTRKLMGDVHTVHIPFGDGLANFGTLYSTYASACVHSVTMHHMYVLDFPVHPLIRSEAFTFSSAPKFCTTYHIPTHPAHDLSNECPNDTGSPSLRTSEYSKSAQHWPHP